MRVRWRQCLTEKVYTLKHTPAHRQWSLKSRVGPHDGDSGVSLASLFALQLHPAAWSILEEQTGYRQTLTTTCCLLQRAGPFPRCFMAFGVWGHKQTSTFRALVDISVVPVEYISHSLTSVSVQVIGTVWRA